MFVDVLHPDGRTSGGRVVQELREHLQEMLRIASTAE